MTEHSVVIHNYRRELMLLFTPSVAPLILRHASRVADVDVICTSHIVRQPASRRLHRG